MPPRSWPIVVAVCWLLPSCASVPLSTALRMSAFGEQQFGGLQPEELGVKIRFPQGFALDVANSRLAIEVASSAGVHDAAFELEQTALRSVRLSTGLFSSSQPGVEYELRLPATSQGSFRDLQSFVKRAKVEDIAIRVMPKLAAKPERARSVTVWVDLRLARQEDYFALVDAASIPLDR